MTERELDFESRAASGFQSPVQQKPSHQRLDTLNFTAKDISGYGEGEKKEPGEPESPLREISMNTDKDRQINRLAKSLKQKIEEVIQVEDSNKQLKEKLKLFQVSSY